MSYEVVYQVDGAERRVPAQDPSDAIKLAREVSRSATTAEVYTGERRVFVFREGKVIKRLVTSDIYWQEYVRLRVAWDQEALPSEPVYEETLARFFKTLPWRITQSWERAAVEYYQWRYDMQASYTEEENAQFKAACALLTRLLPEKYVGKVVKIGSQVCYLGEDLWVVDGQLQHPAHLKHRACGTYAVLRRGGQDFCGECQTMLARGDTEMFS